MSIILSIAILLMISTVALPSLNAQTLAPGKTIVPTWAYVIANPNPTGVGQTVNLGFFVDKAPPTAYFLYGDRWHNMTVLLTKPDGTTQTLGPFTSDATGGTFTRFTPDQVGNYTFVFTFPGDYVIGANPPPTGTNNPSSVGNYYAPSTSEKYTLTVQEEPIPDFPSAPLPTEYWTRPIFAMNTEWYQISGNWLGLGIESFANTGQYNAISNFNPYTKAPTTAHILWTKSYAPGGLIGGEFGNSQEDSMFMSTNQYEPKFAPIIMNGILYYNSYTGAYSSPQGWVAVNLQTGETLWTKNTTQILRCGQLMDYVSPNQYGALPYLWAREFLGTSGTQGSPVYSNTYSMYDATTGNWILDVVNGTAVTMTQDEHGSLLGYYTNSTDGTLVCWNSTRAIMQYGLRTGQNIDDWLWRPPQGAKIDWGLGVQWTTKIPTNISGAAITPALGINKVTSDVVFMNGMGSVANSRFWTAGYEVIAGFDAKTGQLLWGPRNQTQVTGARMSGLLYAIGPAGEGVWCEYTSETMTWDAFSLTTGQHLWGPVSGGHNAYSYQNVHADIAYGTLYAADLGGYVNAFNISNGKLLWTYTTGNSGAETPYGNWPLLHIDAIADGKLYVMGGHTYSPPLFHGAQLYCLNATTGEEIWSINDFTISNGPAAAIADGILVEPNAYDNQIYAYSKGPTKTTIAAPSVGITTATPITLTGTITDISPGADKLSIAKNFPNGLPCVSDASMTGFMEAVYMQQPMPTNLTGVPITINVVDSNGNYRTIGTTLSNSYGTYSLTWMPDISGDYTVIANFAGTESYYASEAATAFYASDPAATPTAQPTQAPSMADLYFIPAIAGLFVAVIVSIVLTLLVLLRKRP
jgi:outer membrane protein assembly factor BamB